MYVRFHGRESANTLDLSLVFSTGTLSNSHGALWTRVSVSVVVVYSRVVFLKTRFSLVGPFPSTFPISRRRGRLRHAGGRQGFCRRKAKQVERR